MLNKNSYGYWLKKNWYYHHIVAQFYQFTIPPHQRVLQIGAKTSYLLDVVKPSYAVAIDNDQTFVKNIPNHNQTHHVYNHLNDIGDQTFDYIIISSTTHEVDDVQQLFESLHQFCHERTRIIIDSYSFLWEPILWISQKLGLRRPTALKNWLSYYDLHNILHLAQFDVIRSGRLLLFPYYIPLFSWLCNTIISNLPLINRLCLIEWIVARKKISAQKKSSVSIIIPCRNEAGNIEPAVQRCPIMGSDTEIIFVEGHSRDNTLEKIKEIIQKYPEKKIRYFVQDGKGKGDAVRKGFENAHGDVLIIQDADLTAPPEELPKFFNALVNGHGEFINGCRLVYGMESEAMRFLNMLANHFFALSFSWLLGQPIKDTLCGTKALYKKDYEKIAQNRHFFGDFDPFGDFDLLFGAAKLNLKIIDLPIHYKARTYGNTQIRRFYHGILLLNMNLIGLRKFKFR